ncbi:hypothetical protein [Thalassovita aquimarina]|uniref:Uncharacterized protein n=1 Tax=Thalassovita aquimarina TaxID=2785917 RepID=A0ABS5HTT8_9RHOB|nr:hypothetical protein [Thalassovita aquimarina]MBR9652377.1 hypothetical protein [Thalassovita aquimarina]
MMMRTGLADDLAEIREEIARLREREAAIQASILSIEGAIPDGRSHRVELVENREMVFDKDRLPEEIRDNPCYWTEKVTQSLRCEPIRSQTDRPGWPIRRVDTDLLTC